MPKIKSLTIHNFRGIRESTIDLNGCSVVILGENGTGKSSFIDALEFYFSGSVSHLEGAQGISTSRHAPHIHSDQDQTKVILGVNNPDFIGTRTFRSISKIPEPLRDYHSLGANARFILRRKNLLDFILAQPGTRYEQLAAIIGVSDLDKVERALKHARDELETQVNILSSQVQSEENKLDNLIGPNNYSDEGILQSLNNKLVELQQLTLQNLEEAESRKLAAVSGSYSPEDTQNAVNLETSYTQTKELLNQLYFFNGHQRLWQALSSLHADAAQIREILFQEVLVASQKLLVQYTDLDYCPVCLQLIDRIQIINSLEKRVLSAHSIIEKSTEIMLLRDNLIAEIKGQYARLERLVAQFQSPKLPFQTARFEPYTHLLSELEGSLSSEPVDIHLPLFDELVAHPAIAEADNYLRELVVLLENERSKLEPTEQDKLTLKVIDLLTRVMDCRNTLRDLQPKLNAKAAAHREMCAIYECFVSTKRDEIKKIYQDLQEDIKRYFKILHENEGYREISLDVDEVKRASTEIKMDFHDRSQEDPRAFNSEGHLDSLGLCVFLAFVKRFNLGFPIIALDDVVSSIDSGHRQRICQLLFNEFPDVQFFITTHDYIWFEELRSLQRACGKEHQFKNLQILDWSLEDGPRLDKYKPRWERIQEKLKNGDKDGAASDTRKELEAFLLETTISLQIPIPLRRDGKYTVAILHDPFIARVKKLVPDIYQTHQLIFQDLQANGIFGNLLVHNNPRAENASLEEVRIFTKAVESLESLFTCGKCHQIPMYYKEAKIIRCRCNEGGILWLTKD